MVVSLFVAGLVLGSLPTLVRRLGVRVPVRVTITSCCTFREVRQPWSSE